MGQQSKHASKPPKVKQGQPPPVDKLILPAIGIGLALLAYQFFKGISSEIIRVNVLDELELREVLFGEGNTTISYAVLCHTDNETTRALPISSVFSDAHKDGSVPAEFRLLDCHHVLPSSGKSIAERFKLDLKNRPTIFVSGAGIDKPNEKSPPLVQVPSKHLKTGAILVKYLKNRLEARAAKIETTQDLRSKCLDKDICALLLKGSKTAPNWLKDAMQKLLKEFPNVSFASVDSTVLYVLNLEEHVQELPSNGAPRFVVFKKVGGSLEVGGSRLVTSFASIPEDSSINYLSMSNLVGGVIRGAIAPTKIPSLPQVKTRTKKLEEAEREKRQRKQQQRQRQEQGSSGSSSSSSSSSSFQENDGSKEGRKAERERLRAEHLASHNVKPKTPEEIAEMERKRRIRMEEEAAKWNIRPDDAPEEGDLMEGEDDSEQGEKMYTDEDDGGAGQEGRVVEESTADSENEEDVIDLD